MGKKEKVDPIGIKNVCFSLSHEVRKKDDRQKSWKKQRLTRGFDSTELWSLDTTICSFILPRLQAFRKTVVCYPGQFKTLKSWHKTIDKMIYAFEWKENQYTSKSDTYNHTKVDVGFALFVKYFWNLWN